MTDALDANRLPRIDDLDWTDDNIVIDLTVDPPVVSYRDRSLSLIEEPPGTAQRFAVRAFDIVSSLVLLTLTIPLFVILFALVRLTSPGPGIYVARRVGQDGKPFDAYKLRSMVDNADELLELHLAMNDSAKAEYAVYHKLQDDPRITSVGTFLRASSLDELPQLFNVLRGEMSLVGPRPDLLTEPEKFGSTMSTVLRVKPGLTGLWQVSGRSDLGLNDRIMLDVEYATTRTMRRDVAICFRTAWHLVTPRRRGAY